MDDRRNADCRNVARRAPRQGARIDAIYLGDWRDARRRRSSDRFATLWMARRVFRRRASCARGVLDFAGRAGIRNVARSWRKTERLAAAAVAQRYSWTRINRHRDERLRNVWI